MPKPPKKPTSFSISQKAHELLAKLSDHKGFSKTTVIEVLIREEARKLGVE